MIETRKFDILNYLKTEEDVKEYLDVAFEENDPDFIPIALGDAARALKKINVVAEAANIARSNVYRAFSKGGNPAFSTVAKAVKALGFRLTITPL